jgi:hypothetical protein
LRTPQTFVHGADLHVIGKGERREAEILCHPQDLLGRMLPVARVCGMDVEIYHGIEQFIFLIP